MFKKILFIDFLYYWQHREIKAGAAAVTPVINMKTSLWMLMTAVIKGHLCVIFNVINIHEELWRGIMSNKH